MKIADLFINLGIKGAEKAESAVSGVTRKMSDLRSVSVETKVAILAAVYGLERMMSQSARTGMGLSQFASATGLSIKQLQQWQYAARQFGVSNDDMTGSVKAVQDNMTRMISLNEGPVKGLAHLNKVVGFDFQRAKKDTFYVLEQLQKYSQAVSPEIAKQLAGSFGISESVFAAMRNNAFRPDVFAKAPIYSDAQIKQLANVEVAWANVAQKIEMAFGRFTSKHGLEIVRGIEGIIVPLEKLISKLVDLSEKFKIFQLMGKVLGGIADYLGAIDEGMDVKSGKKPVPKVTDKDNIFRRMLFQSNFWQDAIGDLGTNEYRPKSGGPVDLTNVLPKPKGYGGPTSHPLNANTIVNFHGPVTDPKKTADMTSKAIKDTYKQLKTGTK